MNRSEIKQNKTNKQTNKKKNLSFPMDNIFVGNKTTFFN